MMFIGERTRKLTMEYCLLRYRQELELKQFKENSKNVLDEVFSLIDNNISKKNIDFHRCVYEKMINTRFSLDNTVDINSSQIAILIFDMTIDTIKRNSSNTMLTYLNRYLMSKNNIIKYYKEYFEFKLQLKKFKEAQFQELRIISKQLIEDESPIYIVKNIYKRLKSDLHILHYDSSELQYCRDEYDLLKDELINQIQQINKEFN